MAERIQAIANLAYEKTLKWTNSFVGRRLAKSSSHDFTSDWLTGHLPNWQSVLASYKGKAQVHILEIGSFQGRSAVWFLQNILTDRSASLTCVDPFRLLGQEPRFDHNIRLSGQASQVTKLKGRSQDLLLTLPKERFDLVYVDGDHRAANVLFDAMAGFRLLKAGGIMIFDDYLLDANLAASQRPQTAIDLFLESLNSDLELLFKDWQVIVRKLRAVEPSQDLFRSAALEEKKDAAG